MNHFDSLPSARSCIAAAALVAAAMLPGLASAQQAPLAGPWRYSATIYGYLPSVGATSTFPSNGNSVGADSGDIVDNLKMFFMGTFEAHNGRWGVFTDYAYFNLGNSKTGTRDITIGGSDLPANVTADAGWDLKAWAWTLAGEYRLMTGPSATVDLLAGTRGLNAKQKLNWTLNGQVGSINTAVRSGVREADQTVWDGIVGIKGRAGLSDNGKWSVPFYLDVGTGGSSSTVQAAAGVGYGFSWGEVVGMWRYLGYRFKDGKNLTDLNFNGPMIGARFAW